MPTVYTKPFNSKLIYISAFIRVTQMRKTKTCTYIYLKQVRTLKILNVYVIINCFN